jgi:putative nucleotidyltransferase with HDIG domain
MTRAGHLVGRFVGSLRPRRLDDADLGLVRSVLRPGELACWERLGRADRAESVATARALGPDAEPTWVAAALLHDVGKAETTFGPFRRAAAAAIAMVAGSRRARSWANGVGRYVTHDELGAARLRAAGARPEVVAWAAVHHRPDRWPATGIAPEICKQLAAADGEPSPE